MENLQNRELHERGVAVLQIEHEKSSSHKETSQHLLNMSIIQSHIGTLVYIFAEDNLDTFEIAAIVLIGISFLFQFIIFFSITWLSYTRQDAPSQVTPAPPKIGIVGLNIMITLLSGISLVINIAITAVVLKIQPVGDKSET